MRSLVIKLEQLKGDRRGIMAEWNQIDNEICQLEREIRQLENELRRSDSDTYTIRNSIDQVNYNLTSAKRRKQGHENTIDRIDMGINRVEMDINALAYNMSTT